MQLRKQRFGVRMDVWRPSIASIYDAQLPSLPPLRSERARPKTELKAFSGDDVEPWRSASVVHSWSFVSTPISSQFTLTTVHQLFLALIGTVRPGGKEFPTAATTSPSRYLTRNDFSFRPAGLLASSHHGHRRDKLHLSASDKDVHLRIKTFGRNTNSPLSFWPLSFWLPPPLNVFSEGNTAYQHPQSPGLQIIAG